VIYLDTSCLLKLPLEEPESEAVRLAVAREAELIISRNWRPPLSCGRAGAAASTGNDAIALMFAS